MFDIDDVNRVDPVAHIRSNPDMYLDGGRFDAVRVGARVAGDALTLGATEVTVEVIGDWIRMSSSFDWLSSGGIEVNRIFNSIVPLPEAGVNSYRGEVLLTAFASDVFVAAPGIATVIKGEQPPADVADPRGAQRMVAFRT